MIISKENCMSLISEKFPEFKPILDAYLSNYEILTEEIFGVTPFWGDTSVCGVMNEFSYYVKELLMTKQQNIPLIKDVCNYIEYLLRHGDEDVQNAAATCFLENLMNITPEQIDPKHYIPYLGPLSKEYCRAWDEFTGIKTKGL